MLPSVRELLTGAIDYAGLFPPARLPMPDTVRRFGQHSAGPDGWMLARLVVPAARLGELTTELLGKARGTQPPVRLAALARTTELASDLDNILCFVDRHAGQATSTSSSCGCPTRRIRSRSRWSGPCRRSALELRRLSPSSSASLLEGWPERLPWSVDALPAAGGAVGLKIRCGGLDASAVPAPQAGAAALAACRRSGIPLQATQGLRPPGYADCATQRNLSEAGRAQARAIGQAIRGLGLPVGEVIASPFCRTMETGRLMFGRAEPSTVVRGYEGTDSANADYAKLVALLASPPAPGTLRMITSHGNPFRAIAGPPHLDEGEAAVLKPAGAGFVVVARIRPGVWAGLEAGK